MKFPYIVKYGGIRTDIGKHFYDENKLLSLIEYGWDFFYKFDYLSGSTYYK